MRAGARSRLIGNVQKRWNGTFKGKLPVFVEIDVWFDVIDHPFKNAFCRGLCIIHCLNLYCVVFFCLFPPPLSLSALGLNHQDFPQTFSPPWNDPPPPPPSPSTNKNSQSKGFIAFWLLLPPLHPIKNLRSAIPGSFGKDRCSPMFRFRTEGQWGCPIICCLSQLQCVSLPLPRSLPQSLSFSLSFTRLSLSPLLLCPSGLYKLCQRVARRWGTAHWTGRGERAGGHSTPLPGWMLGIKPGLCPCYPQ